MAAAAEKNSLITKAYHAYQKKQISALAQYSKQLQGKHHFLAPYAEYWLLKRTFKTASLASIENLMDRAQGFAFKADLEAMYLKKLAKQGRWTQFLARESMYRGNDTAVSCLRLEAQAKQLGQLDVQAVKRLWFYPRKRPSACNGLFKRMRAQHVIQTADINQRVQMAALNGQRVLTKQLAQQMPGISRKTARLFDRAKKSPTHFLTKRVASFTKPLGVTLNFYALDRVARKNSTKAANILRSLQQHFKPQDRKIAWEIVAYRAAKSGASRALSYYQQAYDYQSLPSTLQNTDFYQERLAWRARAALRAENWSALLTTIQRMPATQQHKARWRYWQARALKATAGQNQNSLNTTNGLFTALAQERHYYGWLAAEAIGVQKVGYYQVQNTPIDEAKIQQFAQQIPFKRAVALHQAGVHRPARKAWYAALKAAHADEDYLAAATYAQRLGWNDVSINTADRTQQYHDFNLRYPQPYEKLFAIAAASEGLDQSWVLGLVRQESRFIDYAKSRVGAAGLMQIMPKTGRWAARKKGLRGYRREQLYEVPTNITLGTYYMRYTLDLLGGNSVLATAGYNAGPSRALKWMADRPLEGAIYIETIPFDETRNYVQRVMANAHFYETRVGVPERTITDRIGIIPAKHK